jgi:hypothetical protein
MYITPLMNMLSQFVKNLSGKYAKTALERAEVNERLKNLDPTTRKELRKIILDCFGDLNREFQLRIGRLIEPE